MRRRTKPIGGGRSIIYLSVIVLLALGKFIYEKFPAEPSDADRVEQSAEGQGATTPEVPVVEFGESATTSSAKAPVDVPRGERGGWAELPQVEESNDVYIAHHLLESGHRNFSVAYSAEHRSPIWVAAPMHSCYTGEVKRRDNYDYDPSLPVNVQTLLSRSYGEYTRGHLLGSAERNASREMNNQTFYVSNIAPQLQAGFNSSGGAWNNLESLVDRQVCADTLYLVTGCIYDDYTATDGTVVRASTTTNKNDQKQIGVPTAFYKVMLRTRSGESARSVWECDASELKCAAFIVPHRSAKGRKPSAKDMLSVEELERLTGVKFFANVPHAPKSVANAEDWGL